MILDSNQRLLCTVSQLVICFSLSIIRIWFHQLPLCRRYMVPHDLYCFVPVYFPLNLVWEALYPLKKYFSLEKVVPEDYRPLSSRHLHFFITPPWLLDQTAGKKPIRQMLRDKPAKPVSPRFSAWIASWMVRFYHWVAIRQPIINMSENFP